MSEIGSVGSCGCEAAMARRDVSIGAVRASNDVAKSQGAAAVQLLEQAAELARGAAPSPTAPTRGIDLRA